MVTCQELYDRIRASTKEEVILEEMVRLGFWARGAGGPGGDTADEIRRRGELERLLVSLTTERVRLQDPEAIKKAWRKQRMEESRRKRQETKERRLRQRRERAEAWRRRKDHEILYLGEGVSGGLNGVEGDDARLAAAGLPVLHRADELAASMKITVGQLRFLSYSRRVSTVSHYKRFQVSKKSGGMRQISAPMPRLKRAQEWVLRNILDRVPVHDAAHGFRRGRSIVSNAAPHAGADVVVNLDLKDFFPTITFRRVRGVFRKLGYAEQVATVLALLCSEPQTDAVQLDGRTYHVARGERFLPQGAPTSPAITNLLCRRLDARLFRVAEQLGFRYTRYADDLTFSASGESAANVGRILRRVRWVVEQEDLAVHPDKTRVWRRGRRQEVTGLVVNQRVNVSRRLLRRFRATLFQIERDGPEGKRWGNSSNVLSSLHGFANFVTMVDPARGVPLRERVRALLRKHSSRGGKRREPPE
jgi:retron-type reverse transcriptase